MEILKPSAVRVQEQLARIIASSQFRESPRLQTFLQFVVDLTVEGKSDQIKESTISMEVFGRADMPDDSIVRSAARRLRTRLEEYYQQGGINDPLRIAIPKGSYVPEIEERSSGNSSSVAEEPGAADSAAVLAVLEAGPTTQEPVSGIAAANRKPRRLWLYAALILFCAVGASLGVWFQRHVSSAAQPNPQPAAARPIANGFGRRPCSQSGSPRICDEGALRFAAGDH